MAELVQAAKDAIRQELVGQLEKAPVIEDYRPGSNKTLVRGPDGRAMVRLFVNPAFLPPLGENMYRLGALFSAIENADLPENGVLRAPHTDLVEIRLYLDELVP